MDRYSTAVLATAGQNLCPLPILTSQVRRCNQREVPWKLQGLTLSSSLPEFSPGPSPRLQHCQPTSEGEDFDRLKASGEKVQTLAIQVPHFLKAVFFLMAVKLPTENAVFPQMSSLG